MLLVGDEEKRQVVSSGTALKREYLLTLSGVEKCAGSAAEEKSYAAASLLQDGKRLMNEGIADE